jgi:hypothetical protein
MKHAGEDDKFIILFGYPECRYRSKWENNFKVALKEVDLL